MVKRLSTAAEPVSGWEKSAAISRPSIRAPGLIAVQESMDREMADSFAARNPVLFMA
jgi:hypothetical protein